MPVKAPLRDSQADIAKKDGRRQSARPASDVIPGRTSHRQIQTVRDQQLVLPGRPRSLWGQVWMVVLEPSVFFRSLPLATNSRQWLWAALLILALVAVSAVRQESFANSAASVPTDLGLPSGADSNLSGGGISVVPMKGGGGPLPPSGVDSGVPPTGAPVGAAPDVSATWTTAILAASHIILGWGVVSVLMSEVSLFNGRAPGLGLNFRVAIWATVPLGLMAGLQLLYYAAGGQAGQPGLVGLLDKWPGYAELPQFPKSLVLSLTSRLTLFWLWSLVLVYIGARQALNGKSWAVALVVLAWIAVLVIAPVVTGAVKAEETIPSGDNLPLEMQPGMTGPMSEESGGPVEPGSQGLLPEGTAEVGAEAPVEGTAEAAAPAEGTPEARITLAPPPQVVPVKPGEAPKKG